MNFELMLKNITLIFCKQKFVIASICNKCAVHFHLTPKRLIRFDRVELGVEETYTLGFFKR